VNVLNIICRNQALGVASFAGRLGGMIAPFMSDMVILELSVKAAFRSRHHYHQCLQWFAARV
jgi:hypothetical protein